MKTYELMQGDGSTIEFNAVNLRDARKVAAKLRDDKKGQSWIYEGYTCKAKLK